MNNVVQGTEGQPSVTTAPTDHNAKAVTAQHSDDRVDILSVLTTLLGHWRLLTLGPLTAGALGLAASYMITPIYSAKTSFLPPQQQQSSAASALASLGALSSLAGGMAGIKSPADQYVALLQSINVQDRVLDHFKLMDVYETKFRFEARKELEQNLRINLGKKDGLITIEADAPSPQLAADIANFHVGELRRLTSELAITEAQQRRAFFEGELKRTQAKLVSAQQTLQSTGFNPDALKAEPKAAAENYATIKAQVTAAEVKWQTMRRNLADSAPELQQQAALLDALKGQLAKAESSSKNKNDSDYISRYREYKYQESLFELFAKQFEMARLDESREGALIQVVDLATPPERKSKPKRAALAIVATFGTLIFLVFLVFIRQSLSRAAATDPTFASRLNKLRNAAR